MRRSVSTPAAIVTGIVIVQLIFVIWLIVNARTASSLCVELGECSRHAYDWSVIWIAWAVTDAVIAILALVFVPRRVR